MFWRRKKLECLGTVHFRGSLPPRPDEYGYLAQSGISVQLRPGGDHAQYELDLRHPQWGQALLVCLRDAPVLPRGMVDMTPGLTQQERQEAYQARSNVVVRVQARRGDILRDRKLLLRFLRAVMGDDGLMALDHTSQVFWSRQSLDDELCHDADLDIEALYCIHAVTDQEMVAGPPCVWMHTHGLAEIGLFDFDILQPHAAYTGSTGSDMTRAIAFAIADGEVHPDTAAFQLANPGGRVGFCPAREFMRKAPAAARALRESAGEDHLDNRAVLVEPRGRWLSRWLGGVRPASFFQVEPDENMVLYFTNNASALMAERARATYGVLRELAAELQEFEFPALVKLGYPVDGSDGSDNAREHLWFFAQRFRDDAIYGRLENEPLAVSRLRKGESAWHDVDLLTDWLILTPAGMLNPRSIRVAREIRAHRPELLAAMAEHRAGKGR
jgi:uncharacterized protein YegJ (DUF2314 family)